MPSRKLAKYRAKRNFRKPPSLPATSPWQRLAMPTSSRSTPRAGYTTIFG